MHHINGTESDDFILIVPLLCYPPLANKGLILQLLQAFCANFWFSMMHDDAFIGRT